jgi:hypothetical protein
LGPVTWARYQELKKEAVMALPTGEQLLEPNAAVRVMRLCQITSGHIGHGVMPGVQTIVEGTMSNGREVYSVLPTDEIIAGGVTDLSSEKLDWCVKYLTEECQARYVIVWCRWRRERERLYEMLRKSDKDLNVFQLYGGQDKIGREEAILVFSSPESFSLVKGKRILLAQPHAGGHGLNLIAATEVVYLSNDWSLGIRLQSEDRCHRPGQKHPVTYIDVIAVGPKGQRTIDWTVYQALIKKQELAHLTASAWRQKLEEDNW